MDLTYLKQKGLERDDLLSWQVNTFVNFTVCSFSQWSDDLILMQFGCPK